MWVDFVVRKQQGMDFLTGGSVVNYGLVIMNYGLGISLKVKNAFFYEHAAFLFTKH